MNIFDRMFSICMMMVFGLGFYIIALSGIWFNLVSDGILQERYSWSDQELGENILVMGFAFGCGVFLILYFGGVVYKQMNRNPTPLQDEGKEV